MNNGEGPNDILHRFVGDWKRLPPEDKEECNKSIEGFVHQPDEDF